MPNKFCWKFQIYEQAEGWNGEKRLIGVIGRSADTLDEALDSSILPDKFKEDVRKFEAARKK